MPWLANWSHKTDTAPRVYAGTNQSAVQQQVNIPDHEKAGRGMRAPALGPRLLFFSGGSALHGLSRQLKAFTHNSIHLVTPFDSGGSSAGLRRAFDMPAIGDIRQRLLALADETVGGSTEVFRLFNHRLASDSSNTVLRRELEQMAVGDSPHTASMPSPMGQFVGTQLTALLEALPGDFDLWGASVGNLVLTGAYIAQGNDLDATLSTFSKVANVQGTVRAIVNDNLHLAARLEDGQMLVGQHLLTGKEHPLIDSPVASIFLSRSDQRFAAVPVQLQPETGHLIEGADLICFPQGSFFSSLIANLLPEGVGRAVAHNGCPKVFIPNLGSDPEQLGMNLDGVMEHLLGQLKREGEPTDAVLNYVLLDSVTGRYPFPISASDLRKWGVECIDLPLVTKKSAPYYDDRRVIEALLSLV